MDLQLTGDVIRARLRAEGVRVVQDEKVVEAQNATVCVGWDAETCWVEEITGYITFPGGGQRLLQPRSWEWEEIEEHTPGFKEAVTETLRGLGVPMRTFGSPPER